MDYNLECLFLPSRDLSIYVSLCVLKRVLVKGFILYYFVFMNSFCLVTNISDLGVILGATEYMIRSVPEYLMFWNTRCFRIQGCYTEHRVLDVTDYKMFRNRRCSKIQDVSEYRMFQNTGCSRI